MRIKIKYDACIGAGQCVRVAPDVFTQDDDGIVTLLSENPTPEQQDGVRKAINLCPARVIDDEDEMSS